MYGESSELDENMVKNGLPNGSGAEVTLVRGSVTAGIPMGIKVIPTETAEDMYNEVTKLAQMNDIIIKAAAVADYTPCEVANQKIKKSDTAAKIELKRTKDILKALGETKKDGQFLCGFSMETENLIENSTKKLAAKNADMICANSLTDNGAGFAADTNVITLITQAGAEKLPKMSKFDCANAILDRIVKGENA